MIPVGAWRPDLPDFEREGSCEALNVIPGVNSYRPMPSYSSITNALTARAQGAFFARKAGGTGALFSGDATKLYSLSSLTFSDVSRLVGGAYATPADAMWNFEQFGSNVFAQNGLDTPQVFDIDSASNFSAAAATMPTAKYQAVVGDFLMTGNQGSYRNRVQWSAINDPTAAWTASQVTQANQQDLPDGGWIQGLVGMEFAGIILQEFAIRRCSYVGVPLIFQFAKIAQNVGATIPGSVTSYKDRIFFVDRTGFYSILGGYQIQPIGAERWNRYFWANLDTANMHRVTAAIDPANSLYVCMFPNTSASSGNPNEGIVYNWETGEGSHIQPGNFDMVFSGATQTSYTLEGLSAVSTSIETLPYSLDSQVWAGVARRLLAGFDTTHKLGYFDGSALAATVDTTEAEIVKSRVSFVRSARVLTDGGSPTLKLGTRNRTNDAVTWGSAVAQDTQGRHKFRQKSRYTRGRIELAAGSVWSHIQGIDEIVAVPAGDRYAG